MENRFDTPRTIRRMAPKHSATVAVFRDAEKLAYGVVTNVSVTGACVVTDSRVAPGSDVTLKLSFFRQQELFEIPARIIWTRLGGAADTGCAGLQLHGAQFIQPSAKLKAKLHELLASGDFTDVYRPSATEFDALQSELSTELEELGTKIHETTGSET